MVGAISTLTFLLPDAAHVRATGGPGPPYAFAGRCTTTLRRMPSRSPISRLDRQFMPAGLWSPFSERQRPLDFRGRTALPVSTGGLIGALLLAVSPVHIGPHTSLPTTYPWRLRIAYLRLPVGRLQARAARDYILSGIGVGLGTSTSTCRSSLLTRCSSQRVSACATRPAAGVGTAGLAVAGVAGGVAFAP